MMETYLTIHTALLPVLAAAIFYLIVINARNSIIIKFGAALICSSLAIEFLVRVMNVSGLTQFKCVVNDLGIALIVGYVVWFRFKNGLESTFGSAKNVRT